MSTLRIVFLILGILLLILLILFFVGYWIPRWPVFPIMEKMYPSVLTCVSSPNTLALTFDDVPYSKKSFRALLKILKKYKYPATFFIISDQVTPKTRPLLIQALKEGHQLANHGQTDSLHLVKTSEEFQKEFKSCHHLLVSLYQEARVPLPQNMFYRPGCGWFSQRMIQYIESQDYIFTLGSVYPHDPHIHNPDVNMFYLQPHLQPGDIIILHDREWTPHLLRKLLPWLKKKRWSGQTLDELIRNSSKEF